MKSITTLAVMTLLGIIGTLVALNYYVNYYKPQKQAALASKSPVPSDIVVLKDSLHSIPDMVTPVAPAPISLSNSTTTAQHSTPVPTNSAPTKTTEPIKPTPKMVSPAIASIPKSANVTIAPPVKIVPKTIPVDAGIVSKGVEKVKETLHVEAVATKGLHYVIIGSFSDEKNAKSALQSYALKNLSIHKDGKLYRLSAGAYPTAAAAKLRMGELQHQSIESIVIQH